MSRLILIAGVDEAGRGPLAGPVVAAAVILSPQHPIVGLADSKALTPARREALADEIRRRAMCWAIGQAEVEEIDRLNILQASLLAMQRAVEALSHPPGKVLVDGNCCPRLACPVEAIVKGDVTVPSISAASILAKVHRDLIMLDLDSRYPVYGFRQHKGYPTSVHLQALTDHGVSPIHRRSFSPVARAMKHHIKQ